MKKKEYIEVAFVLLITLTLAFVFDIVWFFILGLLVSGIILLTKRVKEKEKGKKSSDLKVQTLCFVASIGSIFFGTIWYIAVILGVLSMILSVDLIKRTGKKAPKATLVLSIIGIVNCVLLYVMAISEVLYELM